jgi:ubiquitin C-terminal hydrolase
MWRSTWSVPARALGPNSPAGAAVAMQGRVLLDQSARDVFEKPTADPAQSPALSLDDCLRKFHQREQLGSDNEWLCPKCKTHVRAFKSLQLWSAPPVLIVVLKRFLYEVRQGERHRGEKITDVVSFPLEGLDVNAFLSGPKAEGPCLYDLVAVSNHIGAFGGGHYTAACRSSADKSWWLMDDARVSRIDDPKKSLITSQAYVLFYQRRA